ncbi:M12 family metallopeptidase [Myxococcus sp. K15C18031901]|uniref:M12 family metallopeptidase n=1 Tax=Myxococcus dinghuensis TaxID=2906761 RepID=UPI0020A708C2|nr:M12 family metallopeptidase [Myxococcus dinghuensis]MCP3097558.1 M12 family metallopeptidase [Myxococcus dinghuensis]
MKNILPPVHRQFIRHALVTTTILVGCNASESTPPPPAVSEAAQENRGIPADAPVRTTYLRIGSNPTLHELTYSEVNGTAIFEGDIILGRVSDLPKYPGEVSAQGIAITGAGFRWPSSLVPYTIDPNLQNQERVNEAIRHWQERTNVRFILRDAAVAALFPDFVTFERPNNNDVCRSPAGRQGGQQILELGDDCTTGNTIHEIGHTLGLWHEQSREDRNNFVTILFANVEEGREHNFNQHILDGDDLGTYDYNSMMHYGTHAFSANGQPTIQVLTPGVTIGQRTGLSSGDIDATHDLYPTPTYAMGNRFFTMDYDGDGDDDLVIRGPGGEFFAYRANAGTFTRVSGDLIALPDLSDRHGWYKENRFFVADYDGDGDDDIITRSANGEFAALRSERTHFVSAGTIFSDSSFSDANNWATGNRFWVMNYDGDGDEDIVARSASGNFIALRSDGIHLTNAGVIATTNLSDSQGWNTGLRFFPADYDGDGDDDLVTRNTSGVFNALQSNGSQLAWTGPLYSNAGLSDSNGWNSGNRIYVANYDGDSDDDLVLRFGNGEFGVLHANAGTLALMSLHPASTLSDANAWNDPHRFFVTDADGDGDDDLIARDALGVFRLVSSSPIGVTLYGNVATTTFRDP